MESKRVLVVDDEEELLELIGKTLTNEGLDPIMVRQIHELIKKTHVEQQATTIVISHDVDIFKFADTVAMLYEGKIVYKGPTDAIWDSKDPYIYQFIRGLPEGPLG